MTRFFRFSLLGLVLLAASYSSQLSALDIDNPAVVEAFVDGAVTGVMQNAHSPSGVVMVVKDGQVLLNKGYGFQDIDAGIPVDGYNTLFRPGSISKLFTWVSVLQLLEQGLLDLDTDVNAYLTQFQLPDTWPGQPVTLRHIMTHTAGFEDGAFGYLIIEEPERILPLAQALERYMPERVRPPGQYIAYSNWATALAGLIVANRSGLPFQEYVQKNIFDVLGMTHATFVEPLPDNLQALMSKRYGFSGGRYVEKPYEIISNFGPAGALAASAGAMAKFGQALLGSGEYAGRRILEPASVGLLLDREFSQDPRTRGFGLGAIIYGYNGIDVAGHDGATLSYISHFGLSREHDLMVFSSFSGPGAKAVNRQLLEPFYNAFFPPPVVVRSQQSDDAAGLQRFTGEFHTRRASYTKIESIGRLFAPVSVTATEAGTLIIAGKEYYQEEERLFREVGGQRRYAFQEGPGGEITGLMADGRAVAHLYRPAPYEQTSFLLPFAVLSLLVFLGVLLRLVYQRKSIRELRPEERRAVYASVLVAGTNWLFVLALGAMVILEFDTLGSALQAYLPVILILPIMAAVFSLYHCYNTYQVWSNGYCGSAWTRLRYSVITLCSVFMAWIYLHWNFIGFNYLS